MTSIITPIATGSGSVRRMLLSPETFATTLLVWALDHFGKDEESDQPAVVAWRPETVLDEIEQTVGVRPIPVNFDKLMAAVMLVSTDYFFQEVYRFINIANVLSGSPYRPDIFDPADAVECAWAITEAMLLGPPDGDNPFSSEIRHYLTHVLREEGIISPPDVLRIAIGADLVGKMQHDFADDPDLVATILRHSHAKSEEIITVVREGLTNLLTQLKALPLQHGHVREVEKHLTAMLQANGGNHGP